MRFPREQGTGLLEADNLDDGSRTSQHCQVAAHFTPALALAGAVRAPAKRDGPRRTRRERSICGGRLQEYNHLGAVLCRCEPAIRLHVVAGYDFIGFRNEAIELLLVPYKIGPL